MPRRFITVHGTLRKKNYAEKGMQEVKKKRHETAWRRRRKRTSRKKKKNSKHLPNPEAEEGQGGFIKTPEKIQYFFLQVRGEPTGNEKKKKKTVRESKRS